LYERFDVLAKVVPAPIELRIVACVARRGVGWWWRVPFPLRGAACASLVLAVVTFGGHTQKSIYFDF
jgi:hypothetical protein